jgi:transposase-like protein
MALDHSALLDLLAKLKPTGHIRSATERLDRELSDGEASAHVGAFLFEGSEDRTTQRNGTKPRTSTTTARDLGLRIPKLCLGSFFSERFSTPRSERNF